MYIKKVLENGFLDKEIQVEVDRIRRENLEVYSIIRELNILCYELEEKFNKTKGTNIDIYLLRSFTQIHTSFQAYITLLERGLYEDSQIILRSMYDKIFKTLFVLSDNTSLYPEILKFIIWF